MLRDAQLSRQFSLLFFLSLICFNPSTTQSNREKRTLYLSAFLFIYFFTTRRVDPHLRNKREKATLLPDPRREHDGIDRRFTVSFFSIQTYSCSFAKASKHRLNADAGCSKRGGAKHQQNPATRPANTEIPIPCLLSASTHLRRKTPQMSCVANARTAFEKRLAR